MDEYKNMFHYQLYGKSSQEPCIWPGHVQTDAPRNLNRKGPLEKSRNSKPSKSNLKNSNDEKKNSITYSSHRSTYKRAILCGCFMHLCDLNASLGG